MKKPLKVRNVIANLYSGSVRASNGNEHKLKRIEFEISVLHQVFILGVKSDGNPGTSGDMRDNKHTNTEKMARKDDINNAADDREL